MGYLVVGRFLLVVAVLVMLWMRVQWEAALAITILWLSVSDQLDRLGKLERIVQHQRLHEALATRPSDPSDVH